VERADRTPFQFDEKESRRLNDTLVETRLELQSAHDALLKAYGLMRDGSGPGPSKEEINRVAEAGLRSDAAMVAYSTYLADMSKAAFDRIHERDALLRKRGFRF
jgi:hypothetical protein